MRPLAWWALLSAFVFASRLAHAGLVWVEEGYPAAAAIQLLKGASIYSDFVFDKPPLSPLLYLLWGAHDGVPTRIAGACYVLLCCFLAGRFAQAIWGDREALLRRTTEPAALCARLSEALTAFFLTMGVPSAVMALAPDLLMVAPHTAAVYLAWRKKPLAAGAMAGVAALVHTKGLFVLAACLLWLPAAWLRMSAGWVAVIAVQTVWLAATGTLGAYWEQVWVWGAKYAGDTFVESPLLEGLKRTANWAGFHAVLLIGAAVYWWKDRDSSKRLFAVWALMSLAGVIGGWRFAPRYYFQLLPVFVLLGARGLCLLPKKHAVAVALLLLIPFARYGPRYVTLGIEGDATWSDTAMNRDTRQAAQRLRSVARDRDTLLVWGYRPDFYGYTRMRAGTRFLDSQPLTGVIADRHLFETRPTFPELARANRAELVRTQPTFIVDGLGPYNPVLAIDRFADLRGWLGEYEVLFRTEGSVIYARKP